jgi:hypothetical protein
MATWARPILIDAAKAPLEGFGKNLAGWVTIRQAANDVDRGVDTPLSTPCPRGYKTCIAKALRQNC